MGADLGAHRGHVATWYGSTPALEHVEGRPSVHTCHQVAHGDYVVSVA